MIFCSISPLYSFLLFYRVLDMYVNIIKVPSGKGHSWPFAIQSCLGRGPDGSFPAHQDVWPSSELTSSFYVSYCHPKLT